MHTLYLSQLMGEVLVIYFAHLSSAPAEQTDQRNQSDQLHQCAILQHLAHEGGRAMIIVFMYFGKISMI